MDAFELKILNAIQHFFRCPIMDRIICFFNLFGEYGAFWIALALLLLCFKKTRRIGASVALALMIGFAFGNGLLKHLIARPRPFTLNPAVSLAVSKLTDSSFPSGHALACFESAAAVFCFHKKWGAAALLLAAIVGFGRIYLYVHFPSDVLAGALLGIGVGVLSVFLVNRIFDRITQRKNK